MNEFDKLTELFKAFPGVGRRQAERFAHFVVRKDASFVENLTRSLLSVKNTARFCGQCQRLTFSLNESNLCTICASPQRDAQILMVVEKDADLNHIEKTGVYKGHYFVLGGSLPMKDDAIEALIKMSALKELVRKGLYAEIVLALSITPEGEYTSRRVAEQLKESTEESASTITFLGRGLSVGSELEYSDKETIRYAFDTRK